MERKRRKAKSSDTGAVAAQVFLRSKSGKSFRDLGLTTNTDLTDYKPAENTVATVRAALEAKGFRVFEDSTGISLSIDGPAELFSKVFGTAAKELQQPLTKSRPLSPPKEIIDLVEEIHVLPPPEYH